ncbi:MAG TPA: H(+)/Cl(-) exchange transporter ClcA [Verrucomicrobiae bacterium]|nr:H(+)/Cl(-) exchange transporter ClcA [Verrucomicrobiae bacterium]
MNSPRKASEPPGSLLKLVLLAPLAGLLAGLVGGGFRMSLKAAERFRDHAIVWAQIEKFPRAFIFVVVCALAAAIAARLVRKYSPFSAGSGIAHVEAVLNADLPPAPLILVPLKFIGGVLAIGAGLALGPEGPSVQIGACIGDFVGKLFRRNWFDNRVLLAAGAGAGLAAVFNAPIAGAIFVLEELIRRFETRIAIAALGASGAAIWVARLMNGNQPDFFVVPSHYSSPGTGLLFAPLGIILGFAGILYNRTLLGTLQLGDRLRRFPIEVRAGLVGAAVAMIALARPLSIGTGESLTQLALNGSFGFRLLLLIFAFRLGIGALSYASGTPGGLLAPILALGAISGEACGYAFRWGFPSLEIEPAAFAVVGMAAFLCAVSRTPLTAIVLVLEMTGNFPVFLPMLCACFTAMAVPGLLEDPALYDSLRERVIQTQIKSNGPSTPPRIAIPTPVATSS